LNNTVYTYKNPESLSEALAKKVLNFVKESYNGGRRFHIALSGGSTPSILFKQIAAISTLPAIWDYTRIYWVDERCVPEDDEESNFRTADDLLFKRINLSYEHINRIRGEENASEEAVRYASLIHEQVPHKYGLPCFNFVLLGMGADGHTASIFPNRMDLFESKQICEVTEHPGTGQKRITITGRVINNAENVAFLITGKEKSDRLATILSKNKTKSQYPAGNIKPAHGNLEWFLDEAAAHQL
jgi:6-phosphogluconolactonase